MSSAHRRSTTNREGSQHHWQRTVFHRQGRFFVSAVTVRTPQDLPCRTISLRSYTSGRFRVTEELQYVSPQQPQQAAKRAAVTLGKLSNSSSIPLCAVRVDCGPEADTDSGSCCEEEEQEEEDEEGFGGQDGEGKEERVGRRGRDAGRTRLQLLMGDDARQQLESPEVLRQERSTASSTPQQVPPVGPEVLQKPASMGCLQLWVSWGYCMRTALNKLAAALRQLANAASHVMGLREYSKHAGHAARAKLAPVEEGAAAVAAVAAAVQNEEQCCGAAKAGAGELQGSAAAAQELVHISVYVA